MQDADIMCLNNEYSYSLREKPILFAQTPTGWKFCSSWASMR